MLVTRLNRLEVWDVHGSAPRWDKELEEGERVNARFSTDGKQIVGAVAWVGDDSDDDDPARRGSAGIFWDAATGREVRYVPGGPCPAHAFRQNGPFVDPRRPVAGIAYASSTGPVTGRRAIRSGPPSSISTSEPETRPSWRQGHEPRRRRVRDWSTSADGRYVAIAGAGRTSVVDTVTDREVFEHRDRGSATLSKDGSRIVTGGSGSSDALGRPSGERLGTFGQAGYQSRPVQFDDDEDTLVVIGSQGSGVLLYDIASGRERLALRGRSRSGTRV